MAAIMVVDAPGSGPGSSMQCVRRGYVDQMKSAPGFKGHFDGALTPTRRRPWSWTAGPVFTELLLEIQPG